MKLFNPDKIIESYKLEDLLEIHTDKSRQLFDFIPDVSINDVDLKSWKNHMTYHDVPWAIIQDGEKVNLWKEKYTND